MTIIARKGRGESPSSPELGLKKWHIVFDARIRLDFQADDEENDADDEWAGDSIDLDAEMPEKSYVDDGSGITDNNQIGKSDPFAVLRDFTKEEVLHKEKQLPERIRQKLRRVSISDKNSAQERLWASEILHSHQCRLVRCQKDNQIVDRFVADDEEDRYTAVLFDRLQGCDVARLIPLPLDGEGFKVYDRMLGVLRNRLILDEGRVWRGGGSRTGKEERSVIYCAAERLYEM